MVPKQENNLEVQQQVMFVLKLFQLVAARISGDKYKFIKLIIIEVIISFFCFVNTVLM